ncbi:MAG: hypothetical protein HUU37_10545, partial [Bdellovibrionales bacterium]|nr:hypothetical protein [Bdellovibrionales bacterium]
ESLLALVEDEKSINWKKANPLLVNMGSAVGGPIANASPETRRKFLEYLLDPEGKEMPEFLLKDVEETIHAEILRAGKVKDPAAIRQLASEGAYAFKYKLEAALMDATPNERIPLFELLLSSGKNGLLHDPAFPLNISRRYLGYGAGSVEEKLLSAFLAVVPPHERSVTVAYLLSQVGQDKSGVKSLFEVFQTVGIKFGQMTSIWKVFGEEVAKETAALKDSAAPLSKAEIEEVLKALPAGERGRIQRLKRVVGSASLKTVAEVELMDGREAVLLVQRPFAEDQIRSNLDLSARFLQELKRRKVDVPVGLFDAVVADLRSQVLGETKMTDEAEKIRAARAHFERLNRDMTGRMNGYRFSVPALVEGFQPRDNILLLEKAEGVTWARAPAELRKATGAQIVESSLRTLFREGWFDPDRHGGNILVDPKTKTIHPIDFGQAETYSKHPFWKSDDRYVFMRFLQGISEGDEKLVWENGLKMAEPGASVDLAGLRTRLAGALDATKDKPVHDRIIAVTNAFVDSGGKFERRFSFGGLKGLMILHGEQYVSSEEFASILKQEAAALIRSKLPLACADYFRKVLASGR